MFKKEKWPFIPESLSEIIDMENLTVIQTGCCLRLGKPLNIIEYYNTEGFRRILPIPDEQRQASFCGHLHKIDNGDKFCENGDFEQAEISLNEFNKTGNPFRTFNCPMGLIDMTYVIQVRDRPVAIFLSGQYSPPEETDAIQKAVINLGTGIYSDIQPTESQQDDIFYSIAELQPMPEDVCKCVRLEVDHIEHIAKTTYEHSKRLWEQEFLDQLRKVSLETDSIKDRNQLRQKLENMLELIKEFCHCRYVIFFGSVQEGDTVLAPLASAGLFAEIVKNLPHFNLKKITVPTDSFNYQDLTKWCEGIRGNNCDHFTNVSYIISVSLGQRYRGILALGPFEEKFELEQERRFLQEIADTVGSFVLTVLEFLYLKRERQRWETAALLLTHQLRTALTPIITLIGRAKALIIRLIKPSDVERIKEFLNSAEDLSMRLTMRAKETLAGHVLQIERDDLKFERYPLSVLVANCATGYIDEARKKGRILVVDSSIESLPQAEIDVGRFSIALGNLIDNAIKYSYPDTRIEIRSHLDLGARSALVIVVIEISDLGYPISVEERERIFEQGTRGLTAAKMGHIAGSGLGLWEARAVVEAHKGKIQVDCEPTSITYGSNRAYEVTFSIRIPIKN
jgi:signal transduction histidine kinase